MCHLPRTAFTESQLKIVLWAMRICGVPNLPSAFTMKNIEDILQESYGVKTNRYMGAFGHPYCVNDLASLISRVNRLIYLQHGILTLQVLRNGQILV